MGLKLPRLSGKLHASNTLHMKGRTMVAATFARKWHLEEPTSGPGSRLAQMFIGDKKIPKQPSKKQIAAAGADFLQGERRERVIEHAKNIARDYKKFRTDREAWDEEQRVYQEHLPKRETIQLYTCPECGQRSPGNACQRCAAKDEAKAEAKASKPVANGSGAKKRVKLYGFPPTAVLRALGKQGYTWQDGYALTQHHDIDVAVCTCKIQVKAGSQGKRGEPAKLTESQWDEIEELLG